MREKLILSHRRKTALSCQPLQPEIQDFLTSAFKSLLLDLPCRKSSCPFRNALSAMLFQECTYIVGIHNILWQWPVQFDYMLCEKEFCSVHLKSSPPQAVIVEVSSPAPLCVFVCTCVFIFDHIFAYSHSAALTIIGETRKSSQSNIQPNFGTDKDHFLFPFAAIGEE